MLFSKLISLAALASSTFAVAIPGAAPEPEPQAGVASKRGHRYRLKTKLISGDATKDNLFLQTYHTGAGLNDVALVSTEASGVKGWLNTTEGNWIFELNGASFPSGFSFGYDQYYTRWLSVQINAGYGEPGFFLNGSGLVTNYPTWTGWLVCDWWHGVPQLFWSYYFRDFELPSSCARVELRPVMVV